jgi:single-strand DNA-binding protein
MTQQHSTPERSTPHDHEDQQNLVQLTGRVSAEPERRTLPSGDELVSFRLVVRRSAAARRRSKQIVDTIECSVWTKALQRKVLRLPAGTEVAVTGALRRRFSRGGAGVASWVSVEVDSCRKLPAPAVASTP